MAVMRPSRMPTSPTNRGARVPSTMVPPRINVSKIVIVLSLPDLEAVDALGGAGEQRVAFARRGAGGDRGECREQFAVGRIQLVDGPVGREQAAIDAEDVDARV